MYKVAYSPSGGGGREFIKSAGEEYQVGKKGREYHGLWAVGKNITWKKGIGEAISSSLYNIILGRISSGEKGTEISGRKIIFFFKCGLGRMSSCRELYTPMPLNQLDH